jgi:hypothetical protein
MYLDTLTKKVAKRNKRAEDSANDEGYGDVVRAVKQAPGRKISLDQLSKILGIAPKYIKMEIDQMSDPEKVAGFFSNGVSNSDKRMIENLTGVLSLEGAMVVYQDPIHKNFLRGTTSSKKKAIGNVDTNYAIKTSMNDISQAINIVKGMLSIPQVGQTAQKLQALLGQALQTLQRKAN